MLSLRRVVSDNRAREVACAADQSEMFLADDNWACIGSMIEHQSAYLLHVFGEDL